MNTTDDKIKLAEKAYRIRHKATGLYYCPNPSRLSERGKIYHNAGNMLTYLGDYTITLMIDPRSKLGRKYAETWKKLDTAGREVFVSNGDRINPYLIDATREDFEIEPLFN